MKNKIVKIAFAGLMLAIASSASAEVIYLDFENIADYPNDSNILIDGYYNGGTASNGNSGVNLGVEFSSGATLLCLNNIGVSCSNTSRGDQGIDTSRNGALYFPSTNPFMNVAAGFDTGFAGVYSDPFSAGSFISIFDDIDGLGNLLATLNLPGTPDGFGACPGYTAQYCPFIEFSVAFSGVAKSVFFGGAANSQVFDDITFGSIDAGGPIVKASSPSILALFGLAIAGLGARRFKR